MKLDEFIANVLQDINNGLAIAKSKTDRNYVVQSGTNTGVHFDIAVTTTTSSGTKAEGTAKAGIIQVLGAGVGAELEDKSEDSQVSRIQFTVYVPSQTDTESETEMRKVEAMNRENQNCWDY